jgi:hypothetical protein
MSLWEMPSEILEIENFRRGECVRDYPDPFLKVGTSNMSVVMALSAATRTLLSILKSTQLFHSAFIPNNILT